MRGGPAPSPVASPAASLALLLLCAVPFGGCAKLEAPYSVAPYKGTYTVREAVEQRAKLDGQRINIIGVLEDCRKLSCALTQGEYRLSLGVSPEFDERAPPFDGEEVVIAATFENLCATDPEPDANATCSDLPDTLAEPIILGPARFFRS